MITQTEPFDSHQSLHSVICHTMNTLKMYLVFLFSSQTLSHLVHLRLSRMLSWFSSPSHNFWASLKPMKELAGGYKAALYLRHSGISYSQGSSHSSFSNALKRNHVLFSASLVVPTPFSDPSEESNLCPSQPGGYISYCILVY